MDDLLQRIAELEARLKAVESGSSVKDDITTDRRSPEAINGDELKSSPEVSASMNDKTSLDGKLADNKGRQGEIAKENAAEDKPQDTTRPLARLIEYRKQIYNKEKEELEFVEITEVERPSGQKPFRHDTYQDGRFGFSIFRTSEVYSKFIEICPPDKDEEVWLAGDRIQIRSAFPLLRCKQAFEKIMRETQPGEMLHDELKALLRLYEIDGQLMQAQQRFDELLGRAATDFDSLRLLFKIKQLVVYRELRDEWAVGRVSAVREEWDRSGLNITCERIDFDGRKHSYFLTEQKIEKFQGAKLINELPAYPLKFHDDKSLVGRLIERGRRWEALHDGLVDKVSGENPVARVMQYSGYCQTFTAESNDSVGSEITSRVILDPTKFADRGLRNARTEERPLGNDKDKHFEDERNPYVLCPAKVLVHSLNENEWYYVAMRKLQQPVWAQNSWSTLVKDLSTEKLMERTRKLAIAHQKQKDKSAAAPVGSLHRRDSIVDPGQRIDNFKGKGKGLTFLLHGPPGVGKTMLAECLSEEHRRPLYRINLGTLTELSRWESEIEKIFRQAHFWDAILLIDEAEVVLAERTQENMKQSAWVAVFLRKIEYFEGILFLTTNQIHFIDKAFESRVTLGIQFRKLDRSCRKQIWEKLLADLPEDSNADFIEDSVKAKWATKDLNGRQIRSVITSAMLLARSNPDRRLEPELVDEALSDTLNFMEIIKKEKEKAEREYLPQWSS